MDRVSGDENDNRDEGLGLLGVFVGHYGGSEWKWEIEIGEKG